MSAYWYERRTVYGEIFLKTGAEVQTFISLKEQCLHLESEFIWNPPPSTRTVTELGS